MRGRQREKEERRETEEIKTKIRPSQLQPKSAIFKAKKPCLQAQKRI
jgi:hypothetical protein